MKFKGLIMTTAAACALMIGMTSMSAVASADFGSFGSSSFTGSSSSSSFGTGAFGSSSSFTDPFGSSSSASSSSAPSGFNASQAAGSSSSFTDPFGSGSSSASSSSGSSFSGSSSSSSFGTGAFGNNAFGGSSSSSSAPSSPAPAPQQSNSASTLGNSYATVDISNAKNGTIKVKYTGGGSSRIKVQLIKTGTYNYDLNTKGKYEEFPLNMGSGSYTVKVMQNIGGNRYTAVYATTISVQMTSENAPYLTSSQYVNYTKDTKVIAKAKSLCKGKTSDLKKIDAIYDYVIDLLNYDTKKAKTVKSGYLPNLDAIYNSKKGICFDYAAMLAAMLRSQGIPTRLVTGYVGKEGLYHAWNEVYTKETGWVSKVISFDGRRWKLMDPTFASSGNSSKSIMDFIANTSNYRIKYTY